MYNEYKRNWCTDNACWNPAVHENYPEHAQATKKRSSSKGSALTSSEVTYVNQFGDRFGKNSQGQVTSFRYRHNDTTYSMAYDENSKVKSISSSNGWTWTKRNDEEFAGWLVRNYFESWAVTDTECGDIKVDETGITSLGGSCAAIGLPERP